MAVGSREGARWIAAGAVVSGTATYIFLVVTARALGPVRYGEFSLFWAAIVIASLGAFLPVEQVIARRVATNGGTGLLRVGVRLALVLAAMAVAVHTVLWFAPGNGRSSAVAVAMVLAFGVAGLGFATQFPARGVLAGRHALREYAVVVCVDAIVRAVAVSVLWAGGVTATGAYAAAVGISALTCGLVGLFLVRRTTGGVVRLDDGQWARPTVDLDLPRSLGRNVSPLVVAMLCMQGLLNSSMVVAGTVTVRADVVLAGHLLAVVTLARLPVFLMQAAQAGYVGRIAAIAHQGDSQRLIQLLTRLAAGVAALGLATFVVAVAVGPQLVRLLFGRNYEITRSAAALVAGGIAVYLLASATNDVAVALGLHRFSGPAWVGGAAAAVALALGVPDMLLRSTLPLLGGSVVAAGVLLPAVLHRMRSRA